MNLKKYSFIKPYLLLLPVLLVLLGLFLGGVISAIAQSLGYFPLLGLEEVTLKYYTETLSDPAFLLSLQYSFYISFFSSVISVIIGVLLAYQIFKLPKEHKLVTVFYKLPIIVPHIVVSLMIFLLFTQSGLLARISYHLGFIKEMTQFPYLVFDRLGIGIIFSYLWKQIPFVTLITYTILKNINNSWEEVALNLGASERQVFWHVYLPLTLPSIGTAFIIVFAFCFGAFEIPLLLGPTQPRVLPILAYQRFSSLDLMQRPYAMAITVILALICICLIFIYKKLLSYAVDIL